MANDPFAVLTQLGPGFFGIFLPFVFTFAITFGLLSKIKLFGEGKGDRINAVLALVIGLFVTAVGGPQLAAFFISLSSGAAIFLAGFLVIILFVSLFGYGPDFKHAAVLAVVVIIGVVLFLVSSGSFFNIQISQDLANLIFVGIILIAVVWFVVGYSSKPEGGAGPRP